MKPFERHSEPEFLIQNTTRWNQQWADLKLRNPGAKFNWYIHKKTPVNQLLLPFLAESVQNHCSYCDSFPPRLTDDTIDHFLPKGVPEFYQYAYSWSNLYFACGHCQKAKMEQYSDKLLRPDSEDYSFNRYFVYNYNSHELEVATSASVADQRRSKVSIDVFQINHPSQTTMRRHAWERWNSKPEKERFAEDFPYRFIFE